MSRRPPHPPRPRPQGRPGGDPRDALLDARLRALREAHLATPVPADTVARVRRAVWRRAGAGREGRRAARLILGLVLAFLAGWAAARAGVVLPTADPGAHLASAWNAPRPTARDAATSGEEAPSPTARDPRARLAWLVTSGASLPSVPKGTLASWRRLLHDPDRDVREGARLLLEAAGRPGPPAPAEGGSR